MTSATTLGISSDALNAWAALSDAIDRLTDDGRRPVCASRPEQWSSDAKPAARVDAAEACGYCPIHAACDAFATANGEQHGVWGGHDRTKTTSRKKRARAA